MRRYFFNVHGERSAPDQVDEELPNNEAAWHEATLIAGELFKEIDGNFRPGQEWSLEVTDAQESSLLHPCQRRRDLRADLVDHPLW
jgi:hypothetical protein